MTHDPLCEYKEPECECHACYVDCRCDCELIAKVRADERAKAMAEDKWISAREAREYEADIRADEREKAARVIYRNCGHTKSVGAEPCWHDVMVNAVRGES